MTERIRRITVTPIAFPDPPLLNSAGAHEPLALRAIVELETSSGVVGLGEAHGSARLLAEMGEIADALLELPVHATAEAGARVAAILGRARGDRAFAPFEVAMLDAFARLLGVPLVELLGGAVRERVEFSGYLFYKWAGHLDEERPDAWGEVATPEQLVGLARRFEASDGFRSWKLKGGVRPIAEELEGVRALRHAFPDSPVRIDPNCRWSLDASVEAAQQLDGVAEYLEDPCLGLAAMRELRERVAVPLATNMLAEDFDAHLPVIAERAADIVLLDHHVVGGLRRAVTLASLCEAAGIGLSMHSNSHLGISFAAMIHLAAAVTGDVRTNDTHYPWNREHDIIVGGPIPIEGGTVAVPGAQGLGVELDHELHAIAHERYLASDIRERNDGAYARRLVPGFSGGLGRWTARRSGWVVGS
ncbi:glucarate dehydratase [Agromyces sp. ISL-38]|uniref:enolase C-terminal domain-like protein n=1 Tax=Agromyces sp. ISL-38 TaxID=2819107 RepID=UPI001BE9D23B|nr:enolase C-terminal domain-like protein [Agromyces sp. ISL-38]MBT2497924.1 glucarate dehydratase [Agromyces sp. ISL-38]